MRNNGVSGQALLAARHHGGGSEGVSEVGKNKCVPCVSRLPSSNSHVLVIPNGSTSRGPAPARFGSGIECHKSVSRSQSVISNKDALIKSIWNNLRFHRS